MATAPTTPPPLTPPTDTPDRGAYSGDVYTNIATAYMDWLAANQGEQVTLSEWLETTAGQVYANALEAEGYAIAAADSAVTASSTANNQGAWSGLTGPASPPFSVTHNGSIWILETPIADITLSEPGVSGDWQENPESASLSVWKERLYPLWISDYGDGNPFPYPQGMIVNHAGQNWISNEDANQEEPGTGGKWSEFRNPAGDAVFSATLAEAVANKRAVEGDTAIISDRGNGLFEYKTGQTPNGFNIVACTGVPTLSLVLVVVDNEVLAEHIGMIGNGTFNNSPALQHAVDNKWLVVPTDGATYGFSSKVTIDNNAFDARFIRCAGTCVFLELAGFTGDAIIEVIGGSGGILNRAFEGITFRGKGDYATGGLTLKGCCGVRGYNCSFEILNEALKYSNDIGAGTFTENCIFYNVRMVDCNFPLVYESGAGDSSFHGSGLIDYWIDTKDGFPSIYVGDGAHPYNAPLTGTAFVSPAAAGFIQVVGTSEPRPPIFKGTISLEGEIGLIGYGDRDVCLVGDMTGLGAVNFGRLYLAYSAYTTGPLAGNLNIVAHKKPQRFGISASAGVPVKICESDSKVLLHYNSVSYDIYFELRAFSNVIGTNFIATPDVFLGDITSITFTQDDGGVYASFPENGDVRSVVTFDSVRSSAQPIEALEY